MGNFKGHALPGSFFITFALWWTVQMLHRHFTSRRQNRRFTSTATYPCVCLCGKSSVWPIEGLIKLFFVSMGITLEIYTGFRNGKFVIIGNGQHATMFFFFGLGGVMDLLLYFRFPVLKDIDYVSNVLALLVEGILFKFHLHGRGDLDVLLHTLLIYTIGASILAVMAEMRWRHNILIALARTYLIFLQGTWFWQIGFILYNPLPETEKWNPDDPESLLIATMYYTWHCGAIFIAMLCIGVGVACFHKKFRPTNGIEIDMKPLMKTETNGHSYVAVRKESDDSEFET